MTYSGCLVVPLIATLAAWTGAVLPTVHEPPEAVALPWFKEPTLPTCPVEEERKVEREEHDRALGLVAEAGEVGGHCGDEPRDRGDLEPTTRCASEHVSQYPVTPWPT